MIIVYSQILNWEYPKALEENKTEVGPSGIHFNHSRGGSKRISSSRPTSAFLAKPQKLNETVFQIKEIKKFWDVVQW